MNVVMDQRRVGHAAQAHLSEDLTRLEGLWIDAGLCGARYIPAEHIAMLGRVAVITDSPGARKRICQRALFRRAVSTDGRRLGAIVDAMVNEISFTVDALELSRGVWDDLMHGRGLVQHFRVDPDTGNIVVEDEITESKEGNTACEAE